VFETDGIDVTKPSNKEYLSLKSQETNTT